MSLSKILEGKKTYLGIATTLLGLFMGEADVGMIVDGLDKILIAVGSIFAAYGRFQTKGGGQTKPPGSD